MVVVDAWGFAVCAVDDEGGGSDHDGELSPKTMLRGILKE